MFHRFLNRLVGWIRRDSSHEENTAAWRECTLWCTMMEIRRNYPDKPFATESERIAYQVFYFCVAQDSELMTGLLSQSESDRQAMRESLLALGLTDQANNAAEAANALAKSGLSLDRSSDHDALSELFKPFETRYQELRLATYERLLEFIHSSDFFPDLVEAAQRCEREGLHLFSPDVWKHERAD